MTMVDGVKSRKRTSRMNQHRQTRNPLKVDPVAFRKTIRMIHHLQRQTKMALDLNQIKEVRKKPINKSKIPLMKSHESQLKFHSVPTLGRDAYGAANTFLNWVKTILKAPDKYAMFLSLFRYPIDTVKLTDEAYSPLETVFDGRDRVESIEFTDPETKVDYYDYRVDVLNINEVMKTSGFNRMKAAINSIMIIDLPAEQTTPFPRPYFYFLDVKNLIDYGKKGDKIDWIRFKAGKDKEAFYDDENYRVFEMKDNEIHRTLVDEKHDLGYCPAEFFWTDYLSEDEKDIKSAPITNHLSQLDWILFFEISKKYSDLYSPYSIYWGIVQDCEYEDKHGHSCDGGFLRGKDDEYMFVTGGKELVPCPKCSHNIAGVGSYVDVPAPKDGESSWGPPIGKIDVDVNSLDYNVKECERLQRNFYKAITGNSLEAINDQAINDKQVMSLFEARKAALVKLKVNFEKAQQWIESTICKLRYGSKFVSCSINYGTEFYLFSPEVIFDMYILAREKDMDRMTLDMLQDQAYETKFRNDPKELERVKVLLNVDPLRHFDSKTVREMYKSNEISFEDYMLKLNLSSLVLRFERENGPITEFGSLIDYNTKINAIQKALKSYIEKPVETPPVQTPPVEVPAA